MPRLQARLLRYSQTLEMLWGSLGVALGWLWGSLGVALGWPWGAYAVPINRPWGGLGVALGGFAQPPFWFQLSAFSISAFAKVWLCAALFQLSAFQLLPDCPIPIDPPQTPVFDQPGLSKSLSGGSPAVQRFSALDVGCSTPSTSIPCPTPRSSP